MERICHTTLLSNGEIVRHPVPYDAAEFLSSGGYGLVFTAYDFENNRKVAIKKTIQQLIPHVQHPEEIKRYENAKNVFREFELAALINQKHNNIIQLLDAYTPDPTYAGFKDLYLVFEFMKHENLRTFHSKNWNLFCNYNSGAPLIADLMLQLFSGIAYLHQDSLKLIHRDIKPENIFITEIKDGELVLKLGDLGHARQIPPPNAQPMTNNLGTTQYRAPETFQFAPYSLPIDIWSAGCVLAEMLTRANPLKPFFNSDDPQKVNQMHMRFSPTTIPTSFSDSELPQWQNIEKWGPYFRHILIHSLKIAPAERVTAIEVINFDPLGSLNLQKYHFEAFNGDYEESPEDLRRPTDWRRKIHDKLLQEYNQPPSTTPQN